MSVIIFSMQQSDIPAVAKVHAEQFLRQKDSVKWIGCNFAAFPRILIFVARDEKNDVVGYIQWIQKSGFRQESVIELEQIAVVKSQQGKGVGTLLIEKSLRNVKKYLEESGSNLKAILVTTRTDNLAKSLYEKVLKVKEIAIVKDLYSHDEVILLANVS